MNSCAQKSVKKMTKGEPPRARMETDPPLKGSSRISNWSTCTSHQWELASPSGLPVITARNGSHTLSRLPSLLWDTSGAETYTKLGFGSQYDLNAQSERFKCALLIRYFPAGRWGTNWITWTQRTENSRQTSPGRQLVIKQMTARNK